MKNFVGRLVRAHLAVMAAASLVFACAGEASVKVKSANSADEETKWSDPAPPTPATSPPAETATPAAPAVPASAPITGCELRCFQPRQGTITAAETTQIANALDGVRNAVMRCREGRRPWATYTLRFGVGGELHDIGVEFPRHEVDEVCADEVRGAKPALTLAGRATVRCIDHCGVAVTATNHYANPYGE